MTLIISDNNTLVCCQATTCSAGKTGMIVLKLEIYNDLNIIKSITHSQFWRTFIAPKASAEGACILSKMGYYSSFMIGYCDYDVVTVVH